MAGEQPFYLNISPEENLTDIRERLAQIPNRLIVLIVPRQTRLRNLHSWNLLHHYADDLGKEVWVISDDSPIIEVARRAQFRVGSPGGSRRGSNAGRGAKSAAAQREANSRGTKGISRFHPFPAARQAPTASRSSERGPRLAPSSPLPPSAPAREEADEIHSSGEDDEPEFASRGPLSPPPVGGQGNHRNFDFRLAAQSPLRPVEATPEPGDEEMDSFPYNYEQSQKIRQAAQQKGEEDDTDVIAGPDTMLSPRDRMAPPVEQDAQEETMRRPSSPLSAPLARSAEALDDPYAIPDDFQPLPLSEQRGAAPIHPFDSEEVDSLSPYAADDTLMQGDIEDLGDDGMDELPVAEEPLAQAPWEEEEADVRPDEQEEEVTDLPPIPYRPRSGQLSPAAPDRGTEATAFNPAETEEQEEEIEDQPTRVIRPALSLPDVEATQNAGRASTGEAAAAKPPVVPGTAGRQGGSGPVGLPLPARASARPSQAQAPRRQPAPARSRKPLFSTRRRRRQGWARPLLVAIAVLFIAGIILFVVPSADVTVTLAAQSYSWPVVVTASTSQNLAQHTVPLYTISFNSSVTQSGKASGTNTTVGTAKATGIVQFTNDGSQSVLIPNNTIVSTANNVLFATEAELLVGAGSTLPVPVQALTPGASGNVAANTITVIPASSLSQIEQARENQGVTVKLTVTNPQPTSGGGTGTATTVTKKDVSDLQTKASAQLYQKLQAWLAQQQARGNVLAKQVQESQLGTYETVKATPDAGQKAAADGTFTETVSLTMPLQFIHASDLQAQALAQYHRLPTGATKPPKGYEPVAGQPVSLQPKDCASSSKSSTANASTLCFTASAPVAAPITEQQVQNLINGRRVDVVRAQLASSKTGLPGIKAVKVNVSPGFWPWLPFWTQRITVHFTT